MDDLNAFEDIATRLSASTSAIAFTGAGISTESGIPDFRSPGGVWSRRRPILFDEFLASHEARAEYWAMKKEAHADFAGAEPNAGHRVLAALERDGALAAIVTQNIDGLHQDAGSERVLELHGTSRRVTCLSCAASLPAEDVMARMERESIDVPLCDGCGGILKPATVSFGQQLPADVLAESEELALSCDVCLAVGSSLVVHPAAGIPIIAAQNGACLVIVNREETPLDGIATHVIRTPIGDALTAIHERYLRAVRHRLG